MVRLTPNNTYLKAYPGQWAMPCSTALPRRCARQASPSYEFTHTCKQAWPTEHEVEGSNPLPSSFDEQAGISPDTCSGFRYQHWRFHRNATRGHTLTDLLDIFKTEV